MSEPTRSTSTGGSTSERYKLLEVIGSGSFGEVFRGTDSVTKRDVAVKVVDLDDV